MSEVKTNFLTEKDAAKFLTLSEKTLQRYRTGGGGPSFYKLGNRVVYKTEDLESWAGESKHASTSDYKAPKK